MCSSGNGIFAGQNALATKCAKAIESLSPEKQRRVLELRRRLAQEENRFGLELVEMV